MMIARRGGMGNLRDFVTANFPEPHNPIWQPNWDQNPGIGNLRDFVDANFPEPHNPIYSDQRTGIRGMGCGGSCGCADCGMGAVSVPSFAAAWPAPLNEKWGPLPVIYWAGIAVAAVVVLPMVTGGGRRRR